MTAVTDVDHQLVSADGHGELGPDLVRPEHDPGQHRPRIMT